MNRTIAGRAVVMTALLGSTVSCQGTSPVSVGVGTIQHETGLCNSWFLITDRGTNLEMLDVKPEFQTAGLRVKFVVKRRADMMSDCMAGDIVQVLSLQKL